MDRKHKGAINDCFDVKSVTLINDGIDASKTKDYKCAHGNVGRYSVNTFKVNML